MKLLRSWCYAHPYPQQPLLSIACYAPFQHLSPPPKQTTGSRFRLGFSFIFNLTTNKTTAQRTWQRPPTPPPGDCLGVFTLFCLFFEEEDDCFQFRFICLSSSWNQTQTCTIANIVLLKRFIIPSWRKCLSFFIHDASERWWHLPPPFFVRKRKRRLCGKDVIKDKGSLRSPFSSWANFTPLTVDQKTVNWETLSATRNLRAEQNMYSKSRANICQDELTITLVVELVTAASNHLPQCMRPLIWAIIFSATTVHKSRAIKSLIDTCIHMQVSMFVCVSFFCKSWHAHYNCRSICSWPRHHFSGTRQEFLWMRKLLRREDVSQTNCLQNIPRNPNKLH